MLYHTCSSRQGVFLSCNVPVITPKSSCHSVFLYSLCVPSSYLPSFPFLCLICGTFVSSHHTSFCNRLDLWIEDMEINLHERSPPGLSLISSGSRIDIKLLFQGGNITNIGNIQVLAKKHRENRKTLPFKILFSSQYVKFVFTKNVHYY